MSENQESMKMSSIEEEIFLIFLKRIICSHLCREIYFCNTYVQYVRERTCIVRV